MSDAPRDPSRLHLVVLTPEEVLFAGEVLWAQMPLVDGLIGVWPGHSPLVGRMAAGTLEYATPEGVEAVAVHGGVVRVDDGRCIVLVGAPAHGAVDEWTSDSAGMAPLEEDDQIEAILESALSGDEPRDWQDE